MPVSIPRNLRVVVELCSCMEWIPWISEMVVVEKMELDDEIRG